LNKARQIAQSSMALLAGNAANKITGFLIMLSVARFLGAEQFGLYTFVFSYVWVFSILTDLGLTNIVAREIAREEETGRLWLGNAVAVRWAAALVVYLLCLAGSFFYNGWSQRTSLIAISALSFFYSPLSSANAVFTAKLKLYGASAASLVSRLILLVIIQMLARQGASVAALIVVEVLLGGLTSLALWIWASRMLRPSYRLDFAVIKVLLKQGIPLLMTSVFVALYFRMDVFFLEYFVGAAAVGTYAAAYRLTEAVPLAATAFTSSIFPVICQLLHRGEEPLLRKLTGSAQKILLAMVMPVVLGLAWFALPVVRLLYVGRFDASSTALAILGCAQIFVFSNILSSTLLVARNRGQQLMVVTLGMVPLNAILNYLVIPRFGVAGAAATTLATELGGAIVLLILTGTLGSFANGTLKVLPPALLAGLSVWLWAHFLPEGFYWQLPAMLAVYALAILMMRVFDQEEWGRLRRVFS
jgi:O-antigen/teichoic acid export membrane protein